MGREPVVGAAISTCFESTAPLFDELSRSLPVGSGGHYPFEADNPMARSTFVLGAT